MDAATRKELEEAAKHLDFTEIEMRCMHAFGLCDLTGIPKERRVGALRSRMKTVNFARMYGTPRVESRIHDAVNIVLGFPWSNMANVARRMFRRQELCWEGGK